MDKELLALLNEARSAGANESQLDSIIDAYNQKKKISSTSTGGNQTDVLEPPSPKLAIGSDGQLQSLTPTTSQSFVSSPSDAFALLPKKPVVSVAGVAVPINAPIQDVAPIPQISSPENLAAQLQVRINNKSYSKDDIGVVAQSMGVSPNAASAFMDGHVGKGTVIHFDDIKVKKQDQLKGAVDQANKELGLNDNYAEVFGSADLAGAYLQKLQTLYATKANIQSIASVQYSAQANPVLMGEGTAQVDNSESQQTANAAQQIKGIISNEIIDKISNDGSLNVDQKVKKIYSLVDNREKVNVEKAIDERLSPLRYMVNVAIGGNTTEDIDLLNANKAGIEFKVNQTLRNNINYNEAKKKSILEEYADKVQKQEISAEDKEANDYYAKQVAEIEDKNVQLSKQVQPNTTLYEKYPVLFQAALANSVNEFNAIKSGNVKGYEDGGYENTSLSEHLTAQGFDIKDQKVKDYLDGDNFKDYSFIGRPIENVIDVFKNTGKSLLDFTPLRDDATILAEKKRAELFPTQVGANDEFKLTGAAEIGQNIGNTTGQVLGQGLLQVGTAGLGRMAGLSRVAAMNSAFWSSGTLTSYDQAYKDSYDFIDNSVGRTAYAGLIALANGASEKIFPEVKLFQIPGVQDNIAKLASKVTAKELTTEVADELLGKAKNAFVDYAVKYGKNVGQETAEEVATDLFESSTRYLFGDPNIDANKAIESAKNTAIQTAIGTSLIGGFGAHKDVQAERNTSAASTIYNAAIYHDAALDAINIGFQGNLYDATERDAKVAVLNTARQSVGVMEKTEKLQGKELTRPQRELYVANLTAEAVLKGQKEGLDEVGQAEIDTKISNLQNQRKQILNGEVVIDENGNVSMPETKVETPVAENLPSVAVADNQILPTLEKVKQVVPEEKLVATQDILTRVNNAENINVNDIENAQDELYSALDAAPEAAHLIEPLILKLQDYEFATKTENSTTTQEVATEVPRPVTERKAVNKSISQWEGNRATITDANGKTTEGVVRIDNGKYHLEDENGNKIATLGETQITDRDVTLPSTEQVPAPIQFDENGDVKSMTLQLNKVDKENGGIIPDKLITINFTDKEKALDYAIQLRAEQVGEFPQPEFDVIYEQVQKEVSNEVPVNNISTPKIDTNGQSTEQLSNTVPPTKKQGSATRSEENAPLDTGAIPSADKATENRGEGVLPKVNATENEPTNQQANTENKQGNVQAETTQPTNTATSQNTQSTEAKEPDVKEVSESIKNGDVSYNDAIEGKSQDFIDKLNTELFGSKKFNFDADRFKEQVRKQKDLGLTEEQIIDLMGAAKKLTKSQKQLIAEVFAETAETDNIAKELQEAFKKIAKGEKPKSVLKRLSVSKVTHLVDALSAVLTYTPVSNAQLDKMADYIVDSIDLKTADQYINSLIRNAVADVRQLLRAKLIIALQKEGNKDLATQLTKDMADEATQSGRQTQSLKLAYEILGAQGNPATKTEFARRAAEAVQEKARKMTARYAEVISEKEAEIGRLNERLHQKVQASPLINKLKDVISTLCGLRNKTK